MPDRSVGVLVSGGLDSAVLLDQVRPAFQAVYPIYVRSGLAWEAVEQAWLARFLEAIAWPGLQPLQTLELPAADIYGRHWSTGAAPAPAAEAPDDRVYLPGRNILLVAKAATWGSLHGVRTIALGLLAGNPFPDATGEFFEAYARALSLGLNHPIELRRPLAGLHKADVVRLGRHLPLGLTFSCLAPRGQQHCGRCNKCAERARAFREAGLADPTPWWREDGWS